MVTYNCNCSKSFVKTAEDMREFMLHVVQNVLCDIQNNNSQASLPILENALHELLEFDK